MNLRRTLVSLLLPLIAVATVADERTTEEILGSFVADFALDPFAPDLVFGFQVDEEKWHMTVERGKAGPARTILSKGFPDEPILYWELSRETLLRLDEGMNGETATARARAEDPYPLRTRATEGFPRYLANGELGEFLEKLRLRFWTRGWPKVFPLGARFARESHGGNVVGLVYTEGMRTMWYQLAPGQHVNEDPADQVNTFDSLFIATRGRGRAKLDGKERLIEADHAYLIPAGMSHELWNDFDEPLEGVLILYGEDA